MKGELSLYLMFFVVVVVVYVYYRLEVNHKKPSQVLLNNKVQNVICFYMGVSW